MQFIKIIVNKDFLVTYMLIILKSVNEIHTNKFLNCDMFLAAILAGVSAARTHILTSLHSPMSYLMTIDPYITHTSPIGS